MSERTWVGSGKREWADYNLDDYGSVEELAKAAAWKMPSKIMGDDPVLMMKFLEELDVEHSMPPDEFWVIKCPATPGKNWIEHPTWEEVEAYLGVKRTKQMEGAMQ